MPNVAVENGLPQILVERLFVFSRPEHSWGLSDRFLGRVSTYLLECRIDSVDHTISIRTINPVTRGFDGALKLPESLFAFFALGDVCYEANDPGDFAVVSTDRLSLDGYPALVVLAFVNSIFNFNSLPVPKPFDGLRHMPSISG